MAEVGATATVVANTGSYDTHHSVALTRSALAAGVDGFLVVTPYYNKPPRAGIVAHFEAIAEAAEGRPVIVYNIPQRVVLNLEPDLLARLAEIPNVIAVKQATADLDQARRDRRARRARPLRRQRRPAGCRSCGWAAAAASASPRTSPGARMRDMIATRRGRRARPRRRHRPRAAPAYEALAVTTNPIPLKAALNLLGHDVGGLRLPLVEADERQIARRPGRARAGRPAAHGRRVSMREPVRIIPLGGLGEVGKNMTVFEPDGELVLIDAGLTFPQAEMHGIDLVLPDFSYVADRADRLRAIILTHGHEDHVGALPYLLREIGTHPTVLGTRLTLGLIKSKLDEHGLGADTELVEVDAGRLARRRPARSEAEFVRVTHSIPDAVAVVLHTAHGAIVHTGDFKLDMTPVDGRAGRPGAAAGAGRRGRRAAAVRLHQRREPGHARRRR